MKRVSADPHRSPVRRRLSLLGLFVALALAMTASVMLGAVSMDLSRLWHALLQTPEAGGDATILWNLRMPRALLAALVGGSLGVAGAAFQGLFRNPLADPYVIGASSGAALGASLSVSLGIGAAFLGLDSLSLCAFLGSLAAVSIVYVVAETGGNASIGSLLLAGSALSAMLTAVVSFLLIWQEQPWFHVFSWLLGGFSGRSWNHLQTAGPYLVIGSVGLWLMSRPLDALAGGDELASSLGLPLRRARLLIVTAASLIVAASVAAAGIVGFIGLIAPHCARWLCGAGHARLIPASALVGAILLVLADLFARLVMPPVEIPVGIITAALGGPFFLYLLKTRGGRLA